jgi:glycosyltransferase involved in cell wall biosynthesis
VVLPSRYEPFGMIAVEAMMLGLPVVATAVGGLRETVSHRETGLLCNLEEGSLGLYLALAELAADREAARAMGRAGHERAAALYSIEQVAGRVDQALRLAALDARVRPVRELLTDFLAAGLAPV